MLENSIWRQYNDTLDIYPVLEKFYASWDMELEDDNIALHNILKAKLTKKEFRLFAMLSGAVAPQEIQKRFGYDASELEKATNKLYKKLKQDKIRLALVKDTTQTLL
jgi:DNA-binding CsgD family transcriptional regulator